MCWCIMVARPNDDSLVLLYVNWANRLCNHISNAFPTDGIVMIVSRESGNSKSRSGFPLTSSRVKAVVSVGTVKLELCL